MRSTDEKSIVPQSLGQLNAISRQRRQTWATGLTHPSLRSHRISFSDDEGEYVREDFGGEGIYGAEEVALGFQGTYGLGDLSDVIFDFFACVYDCMGSQA